MLKVFDSESEIGSALRRFRFAIGQISIISAVLNILMLGGSFFMLLVYDEVLPSRSIPTLVGLLIIITIVYCFQGILDLLRSRAMIQIGALVDREVTPRVFDVITKMELRRREMPEGTQAARDLDAIRSYVSGSGPLALLDLPWVLLYLAVLFMFHWTLGVMAMVGVLVLIAIMLAADRMTKSATMKATQIGSSRAMLIEMCRRNAEVIYALGMHRRARQSWEDASAAFVRSTDRLADVGGRMQGLSKTFRMLLQSLMLAAGAALVIDNLASGGVIIAGSILSARALAPVEAVISNWKGMTGCVQAWKRLDAMLKQVPAPMPTMELPAPSNRLSVEGLTLGPPGAKKVTVNDVSFTLAAGDVLGIIGASGSGKSSLLRGLVGIWAPLRGAVRLDGASIDQWDPDILGAHIGFMPQMTDLFDGTIAQNIGRFDPDARSEDIIAAAKSADVHDLIVKLPKGYNHPLGTNGGNLSAGQRQRVALARALYGDPFLIALDEPNSNLDANGEDALGAAIQAARARNAIAIIVAHRSNILTHVTHLLVMSNGQMQLFGARDKVMEKMKLPAPVPPRTDEKPAVISSAGAA
ncbi:type I secretion system permease/ATPase [Sphingobium indicum]|nr:type I secretion system permease/ATPase [Sphingobium indicum]